MWQGRFSGKPDKLMQEFSQSVSFDQRLWKEDIQGSLAYAAELQRIGILNEQELADIRKGFEQITKEIEDGKFEWKVELEDVHMNIEAALTTDIGEAGKKLHTGRSRNDQVATDMRLYAREESRAIEAAVLRLQHVLLDLAEREADTILPGFTHLQAAQPVTFGHHMLAWFEMLRRDRDRLRDGYRRINQLPLGAAALAGTSFPIDRAYTASLLGFDGLCENSLDAVSDRDFLLELLATCAVLMTHLSRMAEELVLWCSSQFGFVEIADAFCTGSSIMPQKKNPDVAELVRGKSGRVIGHLVGMLTLMKGQPLAYNKDNQEDKEPAFDTVDTVKDCLRAFADMLPSMEVKRERTREAARRGFATATDFADYLVRRGLAFRDAHEVVGRAVRHALDAGKDLDELSLDELRALSPVIEDDVFAVLTLDGSVAARDHVGGTAPAQVRQAVARARAALAGPA
jgi:argininosuccinate lyase